MKLFDILCVIFAFGFIGVAAMIFLAWRERVSRRGREPRAMLKMPHAPAREIIGEAELRHAMKWLDLVQHGDAVRLSEHDGHYLEAIRKGALWSAALHSGRFLSSQGFDAEGTTEYEEREVRRARAAGRMGCTRTPPNEALSTGQVEALFVAYIQGAEYPF